MAKSLLRSEEGRGREGAENRPGSAAGHSPAGGPEPEVTELARRHETLLEERRSWEPDWKKLAAQFLPRKCRLESEAGAETNRGGLRGGTLDSTAFYAMRDLAAGLHGGMTSPARPWFSLTLQDRELAKRARIRQWLDALADRMRAIFNQSNFYTAIHSLYLELGTFGTGFLFALEDERGPGAVRFLPLTAGEYCLDANDQGRVDTIFRTTMMTVRQMIMRFGAKVPEFIREMGRRPELWNERFAVVHAVYPRGNVRGAGPFASAYYLDSGVSGGRRSGPADSRLPFLLERGKFSEFPGFGVRWDVTGGDVYGKSPGMDALPSSIMLQQMTRTMLMALQKEVDPPMIAPAGLENVSLLPGAVTFVNDVTGQGQQVYPAMRMNYAVAETAQVIAAFQEQVREGLFNSLFRMLTNSDRRNVTATEIAAKEEEKLILVGPVLERLHAELFIPLIDRVFSIMARRNLLPPDWPDDLDNAPLRVEFVSILAQAQKMVATGSLEKFAGFVGSTAQVYSEALDAVNADALVDNYAEYLGVEANVLRGQDDREALREARQQARQQMDALQQGAAGADMLRKLGGLRLEGTAAGALAGGGGGV
ncbi:MAG: head-tail connector protein [Desulfovibrio sp.]|jgi:hypothetical protein|nr:head-tail connector protein [Desulfovibrio sp.]